MFSKVNYNLKLMIYLILLSRLISFAYLACFNFENEFGDRISPLTSQTMGDISFFLKFKSDAWGPLVNLIQVRNFENLLDWMVNGFYPGPLFPWLLNLTGYAETSTYILPIFFTIFSSINSFIWLMHLRKLNSTLFAQILIIIYPNLIYYTAVISTDMLFCLFFGIFYYLLKFKYQNIFNFLIAFFVILMCTLTRPNSLILFPLLGYYLWVSRLHFEKFSFTLAFLSISLLGAISLTYYLPYFFAYNNASSLISYWGVTQQTYLNGIFGFLPDLLNLTFSWLILGISKIIYLTGLRPSYSGVDNAIVLFRSVGGIILLPGIFYLLLRGENIDKLILIIFVAPILIGASQERYLLPICPILIFYGSQFWREFIIKISEYK
jgi:hypothetical protein